MAKNTERSLIEKAKAVPIGNRAPIREMTDQEVDLMLAVLEGEVSVVQAAMALGISSSRASDTLQAIMWNAARRGIITVKKA